MGVKGPPDILKALNLPTPDQMRAELDDIATSTIDFGEAAGRKLIETRPTKKDWSERFRNNPRRFARNRKGRVASGRMRDDFTGRLEGVDGDVWKMYIGWIDGDPGYYADQEYGFEHEFAGQVEGMKALADSKMQTKEFIQDALKGWANSYGSR